MKSLNPMTFNLCASAIPEGPAPMMMADGADAMNRKDVGEKFERLVE